MVHHGDAWRQASVLAGITMMTGYGGATPATAVGVRLRGRLESLIGPPV